MSATSFAADAVTPQPEIQDQQRWRVIFSPYVWGASLNGTAGLLGRSTDVNVPFREIFDNLDMTFMGNVDISNGTVGFFIDGQYVKTSQDENLRDNELALDIKTTTLAAGAYYRVYEQQLEGTTLFGNQRIFAIEPTVGVRWTRLEAGLEVGPYSGSRKVEWTDPLVGARVFYDINDRWNILQKPTLVVSELEPNSAPMAKSILDIEQWFSIFPRHSVSATGRFIRTTRTTIRLRISSMT